MLFPYKDDNPKVLIPYVTYGIFAINTVLFFIQFLISRNDINSANRIFYSFGFIPADFNILTIFSSMFIHGNLAHIIGNLWFLKVFGDNVESILGHLKYFFFYICCGFIAALAQYIINPSSTIPMIGASGAIAGVLGAYMIQFPNARVHNILFFVVFFTKVTLPAQIVLGFWFLLQLSQGLIDIEINTTGGIAWFAHVGGFIAGVTLLKYLKGLKIEVI
ncbi:MAG: rhomboid family intramembrane serine protease [Candidatus Marinimicrobia bacterium]|nr:rhomboid family intramembrane serine protease [Candidatus Neomarinimicrobiota bacterium]|tara:strand:- start:175 stop:831 length:657 start_codon:yes stop_codon:yes gene_type:complete